MAGAVAYQCTVDRESTARGGANDPSWMTGPGWISTPAYRQDGRRQDAKAMALGGGERPDKDVRTGYE